MAKDIKLGKSARDQMVAGAIPYQELEGLVKEQLAKADGQ